MKRAYNSRSVPNDHSNRELLVGDEPVQAASDNNCPIVTSWSSEGNFCMFRSLIIAADQVVLTFCIKIDV